MLSKILLSVITLCTFIFISCGENSTKDIDRSGDTLAQPALTVDTVNNPRTVLPESNGDLLLTAEKGKAVGPDIKYMPEWKAFGWFTAADSVMWDINVQSPGEYDVFLEWSVSDEEAGKTFILRSGGQQITGIVGKSGSWETFKTEKIGQLELPAGMGQVMFKSQTQFKEGGLLDLRQIRMVKRER